MSGNLRFSVTLLKYAVPAPLSYQHGAMLSQMLYELVSFHFSFCAEPWLRPHQERGAGSRGLTNILPTAGSSKGLLGNPDAVFIAVEAHDQFHLDLLVTIEITSVILLHIQKRSTVIRSAASQAGRRSPRSTRRVKVVAKLSQFKAEKSNRPVFSGGFHQVFLNFPQHESNVNLRVACQG